MEIPDNYQPIFPKYIVTKPIKRFISFKAYRYVFLLAAFIFCTTVNSQQKTLGLTKRIAGSTEKGYVLFAPMGSKTTYLIDKCGNQVHNWVSNYAPGFISYLLPDGDLMRAGITSDSYFQYGGSGGIIEKLDWNGNVIWSYVISSDTMKQHHDIYPMDNGNILVVAWHGIPKTETLNKGRTNGSFTGSVLASESILEIKPIGNDSAEIVWRWNLWDHIAQDKNAALPNYYTISSHPELLNVNYYTSSSADWIHINSIHYNKELDQILLSSHELSEIWIIDHSTTTEEAATHSGGNSGKGGDLLYRWGNPAAYNNGTASNQKFFGQHNAQWITKGFKDGGDIIVFNNGLGRSPLYSSIDIITPPIDSSGNYASSLPYGPSNQKWIYKDVIPKNFYSSHISGAQRLFNGNTLICSGIPGKFFEINDKMEVVWEYVNPVASGDNIKSDGSAGGFSVFRSTYYKEDYSGLKNKTLTSSGPIEENSYSYTCKMTLPDTIPPTAIAFLPNTNSTTGLLNSALKLTLSENVKKGKVGYIKVFENNRLKESISISNTNIFAAGKIVFITLSNKLKYSTRISVFIDKGCFTDSTGNEMEMIDSSKWAFNTIDKIGYLSPSHQAVNILVNSQLRIAFNESIEKGTAGNINIYENDSLKESISVGSSNISISGKLVTIIPASDFNHNTRIAVSVDNGCFTHLGGIEMEGIDTTEWVFNTVREIKIISIDPVLNAENVQLNAPLILTFNENVIKGVAGNINLYENNNFIESIPIVNSNISISGNIVTINPTVHFNYGSSVAVSIDKGCFTDSINNQTEIIDSSEWKFNTINKIDNLSPSPKAQNVVVNTSLKIKFNEDIAKGGRGNIYIYENDNLKETIPVSSTNISISNREVTIIPYSDFNYKSRVAVSIDIGCFTHLEGIEMEGIDSSEWGFNIINKIKILNLIPTLYSKNVRPGSPLQLIFNEEVEKGIIGNIYIYENNNLKETIFIGSSNISINYNEVNIYPSSGFDNNSRIAISVDKGAFTNINAIINIDGIDSSEWAFNVLDKIRIVNLSPQNNTKNVALNEPLLLTFNQEINKGVDGNIQIFENNRLKESIPIVSSNISINGNLVTINNNSKFNNSSRIAISFDSGCFSYVEGIEIEGLDSSEWAFNTAEKLSIKDISNSKLISVYPNPNKGNFSIEIENMGGADFSIEIMDMMGQLVKEISTITNKKSYNVDLNVGNGIYVVKVKNEGMVYYKKVMVSFLSNSNN